MTGLLTSGRSLGLPAPPGAPAGLLAGLLELIDVGARSLFVVRMLGDGVEGWPWWCKEGCVGFRACGCRCTCNLF